MKPFIASLAFVMAAISANAAESAASILTRANSLERQGKTREALAAFTEADKLTPDQPEILVKIAKQHGDLMTEIKGDAARKQEGELSLAASQQALKIAPNNSDAHLAVAISTGKLVEFMDAKQKVESSRKIKAEAETALKLNPKSDYAHHLLGRWNQEMADIGGAKRAFAKIVYGGLPAASFDEALAHFKKARELRPDRLIHQIEYGRTLAMMGRKDEAVVELKKGLSMPIRDKDDAAAKERGKAALEAK